MIDKIKHLVYNYLIELGFTDALSKNLNMLTLALALVVLVFIVDYIIRKLLIGLFSQFASRSKTNFDDLLVVNKVPRNVAHVVPLLIGLEFIPLVFSDFPAFETFFERSL